MIAVIFEAQPRETGRDTYFEIADELKESLLHMDGFISIERFQSLADERRFLSLSIWRDEASVAAWRDHFYHRRAQERGRNGLFEDYRLRVAEVLRDYGMNERDQAPEGAAADQSGLITTKGTTVLLEEYLSLRYITREELLALLGITDEELEGAIDIGMLPACSYRVQNGISSTAVFGEQPAPGCRDGEYFSPSVSAWYRHSRRLLACATEGGQRPAELIGSDFIASYIQSALSSTSFRSAYGPLLDDPAALEKMARDTWGHHRDGAYGVCVISPDSVEKILSKQVAVKALASFTQDGTRCKYAGEDKVELLRLVENYNGVAMPFSPVDYGKSSRKRLVDDVLESLQH